MIEYKRVRQCKTPLQFIIGSKFVPAQKRQYLLSKSGETFVGMKILKNRPGVLQFE